MAKTISIILGLAMVAHLIRPLGLPGLKRRKDAWRIAVFALALMIVTVSLRPD
ncbi:hypothetical protein [Lutibaculum baratangense]|uniref:Transmembrane protein n=1 Tax=Lutibaculum baratangense AMV1 TaxID=631454 RepID=V4RS71_9HYPH|nr:hypothetical protein [Lutibaculum baratangense]ESR25970.1 hypothetical protein N177_1305 [Lutibaculum baratangense AMV1]